MITGRLGNEASAALHCGKLSISIIAASTDINVIISKGIIQMSVRQYYIEYHRQLIFVGKAFLSSQTKKSISKLSDNFGVFTTILNLGYEPIRLCWLLMCPCFPRVQCGEVVGCVVICIVVALYLLLVATGLIVTAGTPGVMG